ncbi:MAG: hypothetical protein FJ109_13190 [Deltaproteobacteria bacterium]|nr:hypothetical protein [Deltaproteobacteria bacterium]
MMRKTILLVVPMLLAACASELDRGTVLVTVSDAAGNTPSRFALTVAAPAGEPETVECGAGLEPVAGLDCVAHGVRMDKPSPVALLTVRAPGYAPLQQEIDFGPAGGEAPGAVTLEIAALPPFEKTDDYSTGLTEADGPSPLIELASGSSGELGPAHAIKFFIHDLPGKAEVYFQDTGKHPIHYDFAHDVLGIPWSPIEFGDHTYVGKDRTCMAGTLVFYPDMKVRNLRLPTPVSAPVFLEFFPSDNLTPDQVELALRLLEPRIGFLRLSGTANRLIYVPAGAVQEQELAADPSVIERGGFLWMTHEEIYQGLDMQLLNPGIAYGTLRLLSPEELEETVVSYTDVLLLTRLPIELPIVGGTITEELQTPLAHVNVAARTRGTPNLALPGASQMPEIAPLIGKLVRFEVTSAGYTLEETTLDEAQEFWKSQHKEAKVPQSDDERDGLPLFAEIGFADSVSVGVKAANLAELHKLLKDKAPYGFAVPFHYYLAFMNGAVLPAGICDDARDDCLSEGRTDGICGKARQFCAKGEGAGGNAAETLWQYATRLVGDDAVRADSLYREAVLDGLVFLVGHVPVDPAFGAELDARVGEVFGNLKVRLRSSTNTEDLEDFSGAGLYESYAAYASGDKAASLRIRKVWASVWAWRAYEERAFWNIEHLAVRMGVAVNQAFPDEQANGVLITQNIADPFVAGMYVNVQLGEVPVTNPENGALPEVFSILPRPGGGIQVARQRFSSLSPDEPILTDPEVIALFLASTKVHKHFAALYGKPEPAVAMDLEFKFHGPERALIIKQARPYTDW